MDISLFDLSNIVSGGANIGLKEHFRCVPEIIAFSNNHFYNNKLRPLKQINSNRLQPKIAEFIENSFVEKQVVKKEIEAIKEYLQQLISNPQYKDKTIGVVSLGLVKHTIALKSILEDFKRETIEHHKLVVEDATKFQGDERDVMIVSLGVATDFDSQKAPRAIISDMAEKRKINVALSRAKEQMILFHSVQYDDLNTNDFRNEIIKFFYEPYKEIPNLIIENTNIERNRHNVPEPFDSWFEVDIAQSLIEKGYPKIEPQFKVKENEIFYNHKLNEEGYVNFKLDLVVHNNGKRVAIECDGDPFHTLPEDVAYDIERQEFLERVGWKVYRILYSDFKRNPTEEIDKMVEFIEQNTKKDECQKQPQNKSIETNEINGSQESINDITKPSEITRENIDKPYTDKIEEETEQLTITDISEEETEEKKQEIISQKDNIIAYFNLSEKGDYIIQKTENKNYKWSKPIKEKHRNGFLLQCYTNGCVNKIGTKSLLNKKYDKEYQNGRNVDSELLYLEFIEKDELLSIVILKEKQELLKIHNTDKISIHQDLHSKGNKLVYDNGYTELKYKVLPIEKAFHFSKLIFDNFTAKGKETNNAYYKKEWSYLSTYFPYLNKKKVEDTQTSLFEPQNPIKQTDIKRHKSYIDRLEEETTSHKKDTPEIIDDDKIIAYFNLSNNGSYKIQQITDRKKWTWHKSIHHKHREGFLLMCYDNGYVSKIPVQQLLDKTLNQEYHNGKNPNAQLVYIRFISKEEILGITIHKNGQKFFKGHKTDSIPIQENLDSLGHKIIYGKFKHCNYKILPINIEKDIARVIFSSFEEEGKSTNRENFNKEWIIIEKFIKKFRDKNRRRVHF